MNVMYIINPPVLDKVRSLNILGKEEALCPHRYTNISPHFLSSLPFGYLNILFPKVCSQVKNVISIIKPLGDAVEVHRAH